MSATVTAGVADEDRISLRFHRLAKEGRGGLIAFITAGDPDHETSLTLLKSLPSAGADLIELGMPFSDPMADGPAIQAANQRAITAGATLKRALVMVRAFRDQDGETPIILMGYYNPIYRYGTDAFVTDARGAGADGIIVVDLPPEEDEELRTPAAKAGLCVIRLATPTSDDHRLDKVLAGASGFLYYVAVTGITGTKSAATEVVAQAMARLRRRTDLPLAVGFGIKTPEQAAATARVADAAVVGSALVNKIAERLDDSGHPQPDLVDSVCALTRELAQGVRRARIE